jgi:hypothetical protein
VKTRARPPQSDPRAPDGRPHAVIEPNGLYLLADVVAATKAKRSAVRAAIAAGQLRAGVVAGRYIILGSAILEWVRNAPAPRARRKAQPCACQDFATDAPAQN